MNRTVLVNAAEFDWVPSPAAGMIDGCCCATARRGRGDIHRPLHSDVYRIEDT